MARFERTPAECTSEQFVTQPHPVSISNIGLTIAGDLFDLALPEMALHLTSIEAFRFSWQAHDPANLVKSCLSLWAERREDVAKIDCIVGIPVKVGAC
jgi:hypothetical protein